MPQKVFESPQIAVAQELEPDTAEDEGPDWEAGALSVRKDEPAAADDMDTGGGWDATPGKDQGVALPLSDWNCMKLEGYSA